MEIKLQRLSLENFKGIRKFALDINGQSAIVKGVNGTGKTTLMDAFLWLLFNKDSQGKADFAIKTLDHDGCELHNLCHSVEAVLEIDGQLITLKKTLKEKYTKKRGSAQADFTGHTTDYAIDAVPVQKKEWDKRIAEIIDEETFKLLTSPAYFNSLHWQKRREILLQACGDISDQDVISSDKALAALPDILKGHSLDDQKKIVAGKKKEINDRLKEIPARIDELSKSIGDTSSYNIPEISAKIKALENEIQTMKDDKSLAGLRTQRAELQAKLAELRTSIDSKRRGLEREAQKKIDDIETESRLVRNTLNNTCIEITRLEDRIKRNNDTMEHLRGQFKEVSEQYFTGLNVCPACGQGLPEEQLTAAVAKHNEDKAQLMAEINARGKKLKAENNEADDRLIKLSARKIELEGKIKNLETELKDATNVKEDIHIPDDPELQKLEAEAEALGERIAANIPPDTAPLEEELKAEQAKLLQIEVEKKTKARISELMDDERRLAAEFEALERQTWLMEQFIVRKVGMLEEQINSRFALARFKLFDIQINGGISETCVTLYNGVPWGSGLNTGAEINVGLDIIGTVSHFYGIKAPVWIDHSESITKYIVPLDGMQTIKLVADEKCHELEVIHE